MGSKEKYFSIRSGGHGHDDIGWAQPTGTINSVAALGGQSQYRKHAVVTSNAAHNLTKGQPINIINTTDYDGPTRVLRVLSPTAALIKKGFTITKTGEWNVRTVEGNWDAMQPIGSGVTGATNVSLTFWKSSESGGIESLTNLSIDEIYPIPGGLKRVSLNSSGNLRLFRSASVKPGDGQNTALPTVVGYLPTSAVAGATIDIIGTNFDTAANGNSVRFSNGVLANTVSATEEILTVTIPTGTVSGPIAVVTNRGQNATGPTFIIN